MAIENLPIPAENATIARGQIYQLTGLTEATRYKFIVTSISHNQQLNLDGAELMS